jgi:ankyrin repeat protein
VECVQILLEHKADVNARDINKRTPLMMAAYKGHDKILGEKILEQLHTFFRVSDPLCLTSSSALHLNNFRL